MLTDADRRRPPRRSRPAALLAALLCAAIAGCTPWATYPAVEGALEVNNPALYPIPTLMAEAIWIAHTEAVGWDEAGSDEFVFNLPPGTRPAVYDRVAAKLGDAARVQTDPGEAAYHVVTVRVRTFEAEVDLIRPDVDGTPRLMTIAMRQDLVKGFQVRHVRRWRFTVPVPAPQYPLALEAQRAIETRAGAVDEPRPVRWE